jgi:hypothetical protein
MGSRIRIGRYSSALGLVSSPYFRLRQTWWGLGLLQG